MSSQAYYETVKGKMTIREEALFIVEELLQCRHADEIETTLTLEKEASTIVAKLLADLLASQNIFAKN